MPLNPSESRFFESLIAEQAKDSSKPFEEMSIAEIREAVSFFTNFSGKKADVPCSEDTAEMRDGTQIQISVFNPHLSKESPVVIFYPGNAVVLGLYESNYIAVSRVAKFSNAKIILVNLRLAPECPMPTPIYDAYDAALYIARNAKHFNIDPHKIICAGFSSGSMYAAAVSNLARNTQEFTIIHQVLLNGNYDLLWNHHEFDDYEKHDAVAKREVLEILYKYYGVDRQELANPLYSAINENNLQDFPSTTIITGEYQGIRNDSEAYYKKLKNSGVVDVEKIVLPGQTHDVFIMREVMTDGEDPAQVMASVIQRVSQ